MLLSTLISLLLSLCHPVDSSGIALSFSDSTSVVATSKLHHFQLHFKLDDSSFDNGYLGNEEAVARFIDIMKAIGPEKIDSVSVTAYASPEGVTEHNMKLSRNRAAEFSRVLKERAGDLGFPVFVRAGGESWGLLRERVIADTRMSETARSRILTQLDDHSIRNQTRKWRFNNGCLGSTPEEGNVFKYLIRNHYKYLRCLDIHIHYKDESGTATEGPAESEGPEVTEEPGGNDIDTPEEPEEGPDNNVTEEPDNNVTEEPEIPEIPEQPEEPVVSGESTIDRRPILGISTNLPYDITWIPNYGATSVPSFSVEYYPAKGLYSFGADVDFSHWLHPDTHRYNQIHNYTIWARRYFKRTDDRFRGTYLLANINAAKYGLGFDASEGYEGEGLGISAGGGWKYYLGRRFYLDLGGTLGLFYSRYDPYVWGNDGTGRYYYDYLGDPDTFVKRRKRLVWFGPTRVFISVGFDIYGKKKR